LAPAANEVVLHVAVAAEIATEPQPVIVDPPDVKLTVPVAPVVTVAVNVTDAPEMIEAADETKAVVDAVPGRTATRGVERWL
jgi:hypothetical protein